MTDKKEWKATLHSYMHASVQVSAVVTEADRVGYDYCEAINAAFEW